jgi:hypothetical protein
VIKSVNAVPICVCLAAVTASAQVGPYSVTELPPIPGAWALVPWTMNNSGHAVGWANMSGIGGGVRAFLWTPASGTIQLGPPGMTNTRALDITDSGLILGIGYQSPAYIGWIFDGVGYQLLPPFPGGSTGCSTGNFSVAAMNSSREIVGSVCVGTNLQIHAFYFSPQAGYIDLTSAYGVASALAINEAGVITGSAFGQACRLTLAGGLGLLGTLPWARFPTRSTTARPAQRSMSQGSQSACPHGSSPAARSGTGRSATTARCRKSLRPHSSGAHPGASTRSATLSATSGRTPRPTVIHGSGRPGRAPST